jgi:3-isopropylmalate/(R)-2-methylmalate dehydratase small subunit
MQPFTSVSGVAAPLPRANIDTDQIMPKQFLKGIDRSGLAEGFLFDMRFSAPRMPRPAFILNRDPWRQATFLVVGPNFGCGSSREHAVWGMVQLGIRAVIGTQFGGIFYDNCLRNGVPAILLPTNDVETLMSAAADPSRCVLTIDLPAQTIGTVDAQIGFRFDPIHKDMLVRGLSAVDVTLEHAASIEAFERAYYADQPWLA